MLDLRPPPFITLPCGAFADQSIPANAQQPDCVPQLARVAVLSNLNSVPADGKCCPRPLIESGTELKVRPITGGVYDRSEIENAIVKLGRESGSGLVLVPDNFMSVHRDEVIE